MATLRAHRWSGNVRELRNVVESALAMGSVNLEAGGNPPPPEKAVARPAADTADLLPYRAARAEALAAFERAYLRKLIDATGGNASAAARIANMDRPYLLSLLRRHGLR
jgi:DNA-binding NtrC family response regulator